MRLSSQVTKTLCLGLLSLNAILAQNYEYIIIGAGSAGSIVAARLAKTGADVLLLEAGGDNFDPSIDNMHQYYNVAFNSYNFGFMQWGYKTTAQTMAAAGTPQSKEITLPRGRALGGTHSINACAYVQANADDFNNISKDIGDTDWLWKNTADLRQELEKTIGIVQLGLDQVGAKDFVDTAQTKLGFPYNTDPTNGNQFGISSSYWTARQTSNGGRRRSSFDSFVRPILDDSNTQVQGSLWKKGSVDVVTFHLVEHLLFDPTNPTRVVGVSCYNLRSNFPVEFYATAEVIISSGTYNSPQILMLSGIGPRDHLESLGIEVKLDLPGVGQNLRDHYAVHTFWNLVGLLPSTPFLFQSPSMNMFGPEKTGQTSFQIELSGNYGSCVPLRQESTGTVRLQSTRPSDSPLIDPNILSTSNDIDKLVECMQKYLLPFFQGLMEKGLLSPISIDPNYPTDLRQYVIQNVDTNHHPVGTCRVGADTDALAVVDHNFKVKGISNLRVIDASVFPKVPSGNINAPTMTMAMIAARKIVSDKGYRQIHQNNSTK